ncbi:MAG: hypothetical protein KC944_14695 [Candidatus Omnitrophica bacterium]|nr:hypothetical protein [Candidatus Omnitrophota bacterium]
MQRLIRFSFVILALCLLPSSPNAQTPDRINCMDFGAVGDSKTDDTASIQKALDQAGSKGGGVVFLPAGTYRIEGNLNVPPGVTLQGIWNSPHHEDKTWGSCLFVVSGRGEVEGPAAIQLNPSSAVRGIKIYYPEQTVSDIQPYPYAIRGQGMEFTVENVTLVNAYQGVDCSPGHELHTIRNVRGCVLKQGIIVDRCTDIGRIENVHFNPHFWQRCLDKPDGTPSFEKGGWEPLVKYVNENLDVFIFARSDWEYVLNTFAWGFKTCYKFIEKENGACNGNFLGIGADGGQYCVWVEKTQPPGLLITNGQFVAFAGETPTEIYTTPDFEGVVQLNNCSFWGPAHQCVLQQGNGEVSLNQCNFRHWGFKGDKDAPAVETISGNLTVAGCLFAMDRPHILVHEDAGAPIIYGNRYKGEKRVEVKSKGEGKFATD